MRERGRGNGLKQRGAGRDVIQRKGTIKGCPLSLHIPLDGPGKNICQTLVREALTSGKLPTSPRTDALVLHLLLPPILLYTWALMPHPHFGEKCSENVHQEILLHIHIRVRDSASVSHFEFRIPHFTLRTSHVVSVRKKKKGNGRELTSASFLMASVMTPLPVSPRAI